MKSSAFYAVIGIGVLIVAGIIWWGVSHGHKQPVVQTPIIHTTPIAQVATSTLGSLAIYTNGTYGFSLLYPQSLPRQTISGTSSPTIVQIGSAQDGVTVSVQSAPAACTKPQAGEVQQANSTIQGVVWETFSNSSKNTDTNYRTIHDKECFEIDEVATSAPDKTLSTIVDSFTFARP